MNSLNCLYPNTMQVNAFLCDVGKTTSTQSYLLSYLMLSTGTTFYRKKEKKNQCKEISLESSPINTLTGTPFKQMHAKCLEFIFFSSFYSRNKIALTSIGVAVELYDIVFKFQSLSQKTIKGIWILSWILLDVTFII